MVELEAEIEAGRKVWIAPGMAVRQNKNLLGTVPTVRERS